MVLGRLSSYVAKELLRGEEIAVINCTEVIITGNKESIRKDLLEKREKMGSALKGPKIHRDSQKTVKRAIRGMLPSHRVGRGKEVFKKVKCYANLPKEFEGKEFIKIPQKNKMKINSLSSLNLK